mmetsp:Transcript_46822/g.111395  ORF Transcript_46822/g.111395 Transcript_46822/m.111395 type:complete len:203 (-) Transcript_46822:511-1119(-)
MKLSPPHVYTRTAAPSAPEAASLAAAAASPTATGRSSFSGKPIDLVAISMTAGSISKASTAILPSGKVCSNHSGIEPAPKPTTKARCCGRSSMGNAPWACAPVKAMVHIDFVYPSAMQYGTWIGASPSQTLTFTTLCPFPSSGGLSLSSLALARSISRHSCVTFPGASPCQYSSCSEALYPLTSVQPKSDRSAVTNRPPPRW